MKKILFLLAMIPMMWSCKEKTNTENNVVVENNEFGIWTVMDRKNDFDEPTGDKYLYASVDGYFSNSFVSNEHLKIHIQVLKFDDADELYTSVRFDEYDNGTEDNHLIDLIEGGKILNREKRKCYKNTRSEYFFTEINDGEDVSLDEVFLSEGVWEYKLKFKRNRVYVFTIDSRGIDKAMEAAGLSGIKLWRDS